MNSQTSRYLIVAVGIAAVAGIGAVTFERRPHPELGARAPIMPTPATRQPEAVPPVAESPQAPGELAEVEVSSTRSADTPAPKLASNRHPSKSEAGTQGVASDNQITTDVKSQIAGDILGTNVNIGVTTSHGVVALTGSLPSQDAIDHVKDVAGRVKDVKGVDTSAMRVASL
jgi:BON domain-containing protein